MAYPLSTYVFYKEEFDTHFKIMSCYENFNIR